jgi:plastocyanin
MKNRFALNMVKSSLLALMAVFCAAQSPQATTHIVQFGGALGFAYSPSSFSATVGDTVKWEGDFASHPLSSTSIPVTAQTWHNGSGSSFIYVIEVAGTYNYQCDFHASIGMAGSFTVTQSGIRYRPLSAGSSATEEVWLSVLDNSGMPIVSMTLPSTRQVTVKLFNLSGLEIATVLKKVVRAGTYTIPIDTKTLANGVYFVRLTTGTTRRVVSIFVGN